jgi:large subunit ribosomal protein L21
MFAVIRTGGKQYRVTAGKWIDVEKLPEQEGQRVEFKDVLLVSDSGGTHIGTPNVSGAKVVGTVLRQARGPKLIVYKFRRRKNYRRKNGHRQAFTRVQISGIELGGAKSAPPTPPRAPAPPPPPAG